jgi:hypothetical protein
MEGWKITILLTQNWRELLQKRLQKGGLDWWTMNVYFT